MNGLRLVALLVALSLSGGGCIVVSAGISPSTTPLEKRSDYVIMQEQPVSGSSWGVLILWAIPVSQAGTEKAREIALEQHRADALIDVTTENWVIFLPLVTLMRIEMTGLPVRLTKPADAASR